MAATKKPSLQAANAINEINSIIGSVLGVLPPMLAPIAKLTDGKLYELCAVGRLLSELMARGWTPSFVGNQIQFKGSPGAIKPSDPHFELRRTAGGPAEAEIHLDIQVRTLGSHLHPVNDLSGYHEIDVVVVPPGTTGMPQHVDLLLGIECKATANFEKSFVREVLGRRRELSFFELGHPCQLDGATNVPANPPSEYWLAFIDPAGMRYVESPAAFGVRLCLWTP